MSEGHWRAAGSRTDRPFCPVAPHAQLLVEEGVTLPGDRVVCILAGHLLKDPHATVGYHSYDLERLRTEFAEFRVREAPHANKPIPVRDDIDGILRIAREL